MLSLSGIVRTEIKDSRTNERNNRLHETFYAITIIIMIKIKMLMITIIIMIKITMLMITIIIILIIIRVMTRIIIIVIIITIIKIIIVTKTITIIILDNNHLYIYNI